MDEWTSVLAPKALVEMDNPGKLASVTELAIIFHPFSMSGNGLLAQRHVVYKGCIRLSGGEL